MGGGTSLPPVSAASLSRMEAIAHRFSERAKGAGYCGALAWRRHRSWGGRLACAVRGGRRETAMHEADIQTDMELMQQTRKDPNPGSGSESGPSRSAEDKQSKPKTNRPFNLVQGAVTKKKQHHHPYMKKWMGKANGSGLKIAREGVTRLMKAGVCLCCKKKGHFARGCLQNPKNCKAAATPQSETLKLSF
ncbi:hypothetical protein KFL_014020010 [Klebsormidium nitens]|uniref:CCHC-type domain-containing protein n=1 Tax=Klebsormidium nitens TaxID=105231 RepID=A0A1Y1IRE7_KLENI|nr:hypothetical protein KFL_014020010 [Klebsormidium nitens]|eukprot:GAQ93264.1 hypothetical protein KFL_014020010 [Klebsormidium nitens]